MPVTINGTSGVTTPAIDAAAGNADLTTLSVAGNEISAVNGNWRNRIINGEMVIDQRNAGASVTPTTAVYTVDRWQAALSQASKFSVQQNAGSVTPPDGFRNYLGVTSLSAYTVLSGEYFLIQQSIEGFNVADLGWGTSGAISVTVSFRVRSSLTGTFGGCVNNSDNSRSYPFTYTISAANTWETKTVTIAGDTTGTWLTTNNNGLILRFGLGVGSTLSGAAGAWSGSTYLGATGATSVVGTNGATFYITGVQLEAGSVATPFERRPYGTELALCQRYAFQLNNQTGSNQSARYGFGVANAAAQMQSFVIHPVTMRTIPSVTVTNIGSFVASDTTAGIVPTSISQQTNVSSPQASCLSVVVSSGLTVYRPYFLEGGAAPNGQLLFSAEL